MSDRTECHDWLFLPSMNNNGTDLFLYATRFLPFANWIADFFWFLFNRKEESHYVCGLKSFSLFYKSTHGLKMFTC